MQFRWAIVYVRDVEASVRFYERAFGLGLRFAAEGGEYAELETGATALGLASNTMAAQNFAQPVRENDAGQAPAAFEIGFEVEDVAAAYAHAVEAGATPLAEPVQRARPGRPSARAEADGRLRARPDGIIVELGSPVAGGA